MAQTRAPSTTSLFTRARARATMRRVADTPEPGARAALSPYDDAAFLRTMLASVPAFVVLVDADLDIRYINRLQPGFALHDVLGRSCFDFIDPRHHEMHRAAIEEARTTGRVTSYTIRGDGGEGRVAYYESRIVPIGEPGPRAPVCVIGLEVTEHVARAEALRESEEKLRLAVSATGIGLWSWDLAHDKIEWNERMHEITGCDQVTSPADYMKQLVHPDDRALLEREIRLMRAGVPEYPAHRIVRPKDGSVRWVMAFGGARRSEADPSQHMTGAMIDITGQRQLEEHLRAVQKMDAIGALTAGVAHNFNNMLAVIIPAVELALRTVAGNEQRLLAEAAHAAHRAADLVAQLMTFAGQRRPADRGPIHVADVVERAVSMCQRAFDRQIEIAVTFDGALPRVHGDPAGLEQVLVNALINARDAIVSAQPAHPRIVVRCSKVHTSLPPVAPREHVRIAIEDNGIGMSDAVIGRLFEPFFTTKEPGKGTGLGLATSYAIVREHGGFISYESEERVGTTCEVFLPCSGSEPAPPPSSPSLDGVRRRGRILVIDDEPAVRSVVADALALDGHETVLAASGQEALQLLASEPAPDLILFDRSMPGWGPMRTLAEIRKRVPDVPVLFFTGESVPADERAQVQGVLQKPLALGELGETVQRWLRR